MSILRAVLGPALAVVLVVAGCDRDADPDEPSPTYGAYVIDVPGAPRDADFNELSTSSTRVRSTAPAPRW